MAVGLRESARLRNLLNISNRKSIAYAEVYLPNFKGRIVGWSGLDTKSPAMAARAGGIRFADNPPQELETVKGMADGERKLLDTLRKELSPDSKGTISLFIDPTARANGGVLGACQVCSDAILQFRRDFPNITLNVTSR